MVLGFGLVLFFVFVVVVGFEINFIFVDDGEEFFDVVIWWARVLDLFDVIVLDF